MQREPAPQAAVSLSMFTCFVSGVPAVQNCCPLPNIGLLSLRNIYLVLSAVFFFFSCLVNLELWAHPVHSSCCFVTSERGKMTLKSNKNEPSFILDSVNSVRTALSDLYLEQLLQNKPKTDKVPFSNVVIYLLILIIFAEVEFRAYVCFREAEKGIMTTVCFSLSKNRFLLFCHNVCVCWDIYNEELDM